MFGLAAFLMAQDFDFFEKRIRPVLADKCYSCHSSEAKKLKGDLRLDTRDATLRVVRSGDLLKAIRYADEELKMPPKERLPAEAVADFEAWIRLGAPDPRGGPVAKPAKSHWAFQPVKAVPEGLGIDGFIRAKLHEKGLKPSPPADRRTLLRRATFDLTGLPPTPQEVDAFLSDDSPDAFAKVVDRLLASPHYGERWARYWLDLARHADTKGYLFQEETRYAYSYTYRDWVIRALNEDLPYDQFLIQQIAADLVRPPDDPRPLAAGGFLTVGRRFNNNLHEVVDDRIDVLTRATLGLSVACARCHDHKYDPIPQKDYYALFGILHNVREPEQWENLLVINGGVHEATPTGGRNEPISLGPTADEQTTRAYREELAARQAEVEKYAAEQYPKLILPLRTAPQIAKYLLSAQESLTFSDDKEALLAMDRDLSIWVLRGWKALLRRARESNDPVFAVWHGQTGGHPLVARAFAEKPATLKEAADRYGALLAKYDGDTPRENPDEEVLRRVLRGKGSPTDLGPKDLLLVAGSQITQRPVRDKLLGLRQKVEGVRIHHSGSPPSAMALEEVSEPRNARLFLRGNPRTPGEEIPRGLLTILGGQTVTQGSGRLELARSIASPENPLTARVMVNRLWLHHFGEGLVRTPSDFGVRGEPPTHPELLDWLAHRFFSERWSLKAMHRLLMLSAAYRRSSEEDGEGRRVDPENRLLWRMNRRRLDFEATRDALLAVSGQLDRTVGGRPVDLSTPPYSPRRAIYGLVDRANLANLFRDFDFPSPDAHSARRALTTVPQQALFMMNSPFLVEQAVRLAGRVSGEPEARVHQLYGLLFSRPATPRELEIAKALLEKPSADAPRSEAWSYGTYENGKFRPFARFSYATKAWTDGPGDGELSASGGRAAGRPVVRRWVAPEDVTVTVRGTLSGSALRAKLVSGRSGELASWSLKKIESEFQIKGLAVKRGEPLDFCVEGGAFSWSASVQKSDGSRGWDAARDFAGPPLTAWEKYAQILLQTNEFVFVD